MKVFESGSLEPLENLSWEARLFDTFDGTDILFLWRNRPCVIVGKNQNLENEADLARCHALGVQVLQRSTGGGAVYQDMGNVNFSYITWDDPAFDSPYESFLSPLLTFLRELGLPAEFNGRNDLCIGERKFSGSAARVWEGTLLHHGTMLVSCDLDRMAALLTPERSKLARHGVSSVRARVMNLSELLPGLTPEELMTKLAVFFRDR